jgi:hypothetical protein
LSPTKEEKEKDETSEKESTIAEDDGTLYGKTFGSEDGDEHEIPVLNDEQIRANQKIVSDAMNQKFLPVELRQRRSTIFDTAHIEVIKV